MENFLSSNEVFTVDLSGSKSPADVIFELSHVLDNHKAFGKNIYLKLANIDLSQSQLLSLKSLISSINSKLCFIDSPSSMTIASAQSIGIETPSNPPVNQVVEERQQFEIENVQQEVQFEVQPEIQEPQLSDAEIEAKKYINLDMFNQPSDIVGDFQNNNNEQYQECQNCAPQCDDWQNQEQQNQDWNNQEQVNQEWQNQEQQNQDWNNQEQVNQEWQNQEQNFEQPQYVEQNNDYNNDYQENSSEQNWENQSQDNQIIENNQNYQEYQECQNCYDNNEYQDNQNYQENNEWQECENCNDYQENNNWNECENCNDYQENNNWNECENCNDYQENNNWNECENCNDYQENNAWQNNQEQTLDDFAPHQEDVNYEQNQFNNEPNNFENTFTNSSVNIEEIAQNTQNDHVDNALDDIFATEKKLEHILEEKEERTTIDLCEPLDNTYTEEDEQITKMNVKYVKQTVRSGNVISSDGNLIIIGDCHPGSEIHAAGDITVWGLLGGIAHAGNKGNKKAKVRALKLNPIQLRIANLYTRRPDALHTIYVEKTSSFTPEEARIINDEIVIYTMNEK